MAARKIFFLPIDLWESITGQRHPYRPPRGEIYIGSGDFIKQGKHQVSLLRRYIQIQPNDSVLDIGSGIGRTAVPLTEILNKNGKYEGFDVVEKGVRWCQQKITKDFPNFNFQYVPLNNDLYNLQRQNASQFTFPYADASFDKCFLFSVFTHMQPAEIEHYFQEIYRVLKPNGWCLTTFFIYQSDNETTISDPKRKFGFPVKKDGYRLMSEKVKSANIAFHESVLKKMIGQSGLSLVQQVNGYWKNAVDKNEENSFQDIVVLKKQG